MTVDAVTSVKEEDLAAVLETIRKITESWNANQADTLCEVYADDASVILPGAILKGRPDITEWMAAAFAGKWKGTHVLGQPLELRYLKDDVMVLVSHGGAFMPGATEVPVQFAIRGMWVFTRENSDDEWVISAYANTPVMATVQLPETHIP